jgi:hypothetical protein
VDWQTPLARGWEVGARAVQGNLDPVSLFAPREVVLRKAAEVLAAAKGRPGHIFNLGHGILPKTPVDNVKALVEFVAVDPHFPADWIQESHRRDDRMVLGVHHVPAQRADHHGRTGGQG